MKNKIILIAIWIVPILAFPSRADGIGASHRFAETYSYWSGDACYAPLPICLVYSSPARFFTRDGGSINSQEKKSYELGIQWKFWFIWIGAATTTSFFLRKNIEN